MLKQENKTKQNKLMFIACTFVAVFYLAVYESSFFKEAGC